MNYLDLNNKNLNSIDTFSLKRGEVIGEGSTGIVTTIGVTGSGVQLVLKETQNPELEKSSFFFQLSLLKALYEYLPQYRDSLPCVFGLLKRKKGQVMGIVMERFNGKFIENFQPWDEEVVVFQHALISIGIRKFDEERINPSLFKVNGGLKIADLNQLVSGWILKPNRGLESTLYLEAENLRELGNFTIYSDQISHTRYFMKGSHDLGVSQSE